MNWLDKFRFKLFLFFKLPAAFWAGVTVTSISRTDCEVKIRHSWLNQNPFGSIYFASLSMAAEMSSGFPAFTFIRRERLPVSMLVLRIESEFHKKAKGKIRFVFDDVEGIHNEIRTCIKTGQAIIYQAKPNGYNDEGELVATFTIYWSFKSKSQDS